MNTFAEKTQKILEQCEAKNAKLCIVAKTQSVENLKKVCISDSIIFAENRVQEAESKLDFYNSIPNELHLIGPLQKNKVRKAVKLFDVIQSVDSLVLLRKIDEISGEEGKMVRVFLNINISQDENKTGLLIEDLLPLLLAPWFPDSNGAKLHSTAHHMGKLNNIVRKRSDSKFLSLFQS